MEVQTCGKPIDTLLERVLQFKELYRLKTYHEVIDEIYNQVDHVGPWMTGNCRGSSTAFCVLYKFFTMKLMVKQMQGLLDHLQILHIQAGYDEEGGKVAAGALGLHRIVEAFKHCYAMRTKLGDPDFVNIRGVLADMMSRSSAAELRSTINDKRTFGP